MITEETIARVKSSLQATKSFLALEVIELFEKENVGLKKNLERYSQKIAEQEETIDAQDDKINFYVSKMNENILKRQELEKENAELKAVCDYNCPDHKLATHNACLLCPAIRNSPHHDLKNVSDEELEIIIKNAEIEMEM